MTALNPSDKFLINDGTKTTTTTWKEMKLGKSSTALNDGDLFLVNDGTKTETVTWLQVKQEAGTAPVIDSVTLAEDTPDTKQRFTNQSFTTTYVMEEDGVPASTKTMRAWVGGYITTKIETDEITAVSPDGLTLTFSGNKDLALLEQGDEIVQDDFATVDTGVLNVQDYGPKKTKGTVNGAVWQTVVENFYGGAADFTGGSEIREVKFTDRSAFLVGTGDFTFSWWSNVDNVYEQTNNNFVFAQGETVDSGRLSVARAGGSSPNDGSIVCTIVDTTFIVIPAAEMAAGEWQHYAVVRESGRLKGYVNGVEVSDQACTINLSAEPQTDPRIGTFDGTNANIYNWKGYIQDFLIAKSAVWTSNFTPPGPMFDPADGLLSDDYRIVDDIAFASPLNTYDASGASGLVGSVDVAAKTVTLSATAGTWGPENTGRYAIGPTKISGTPRQYLKLDALGSDVFEVKDLKSDPDTLEVSLSTYNVDTKSGNAQIKFGATLDSGEAPDERLPINTSIQTEITALNGIENPDNTNVEESNAVTPISVDGPNATMYGLRFDSARSTKLSRAGSGSGTISYWKKDTGTNPQWEYVHQIGAAYPAEIGAGYDGYMSDFYFVEEQDVPKDTFVEDFEGKTGPLDSSKVIENITTPSEEFETQFPDNLYNTDEIWRDDLKAYDENGNEVGWAADRNAHKAFNGDLGLGQSSASIGANVSYNAGKNTKIVFTLPTPIPATSVKVTGWYQAAVTTTVVTTDNTYTEVGSGTDNGTTTFSVTGDLIRVESVSTNDTNAHSHSINGIEVNGRILVDKPGFGTNGFYLPFNPDNPGYIYSANLSGDIAAGTNELLFNGNLNDGIKTSNNDGDIIKYMPPEELSGVIEVYSRNGAAIEGDSYSYSTNEGVNWTNVPQPVNQTDGYSYKGWDAVASTINTTTGLWFRNNAGLSNNSVDLRAIRVDGEILIDHSSIGYDASGNDNHFTDENFDLINVDVDFVAVTYGNQAVYAHEQTLLISWIRTS